jgi:transporter family protein
MKTWMFYALLSTLFAGLTSVLAKFGLREMPVNFGIAVRTSMVFAIVWMNYLLFSEDKTGAQPELKHYLFLLVSGVTTAFSWIFYYKAIKVGDVSMVASIDKASIVITIILSVVVLKEPLTPKLVIGGCLILAGLLVLTLK